MNAILLFLSVKVPSIVASTAGGGSHWRNGKLVGAGLSILSMFVAWSVW